MAEYLIDQRKNWAMAEARLSTEDDPRRRQVLDTIVEHAKAEALPDYDRLMATVSPAAHYRFFGDAGVTDVAGKDGVAAFYLDLVETGRNAVEHDVDRIAVDRDVITTEGPMRMAFPGAYLAAAGIEAPDPDGHYLYETRMMIVWGFDDDGLVQCEDSYTAGDGWSGIADRPVRPDQIRPVTEADL
ncbi:MAG: nuclear transport factor 2 family protein [Actinomycetota bacterium]